MAHLDDKSKWTVRYLTSREHTPTHSPNQTDKINYKHWKHNMSCRSHHHCWDFNSKQAKKPTGSFSWSLGRVRPTRKQLQGNYSCFLLFVIVVIFSIKGFPEWRGCWRRLEGPPEGSFLRPLSLCWGTRNLSCVAVVLSSCGRLWVWGCTGCWPGAPVLCWSTGLFYSSLHPEAPADTQTCTQRVSWRAPWSWRGTSAAGRSRGGEQVWGCSAEGRRLRFLLFGTLECTRLDFGYWEQMISAISSDSDPFPQQLRQSVYSLTVLERVSCSITAYHKPWVAIPSCKWEYFYSDSNPAVGSAARPFCYRANTWAFCAQICHQSFQKALQSTWRF